MECVRQYLRECVNARQRKIIENEVYGAQKLYEYLCYDQAFQRGKYQMMLIPVGCPPKMRTGRRQKKELHE